MPISKILGALFIFFSFSSQAQNSIQVITEQKGVSLRAISIPSKEVIWVSGSKGSVVKSEDGGKTFNWIKVSGYENRDFRAIHAFDKEQAIIVAVAAPAIILKTKDGGAHWKMVTEILDTNMFLDAIHFKDGQNGWVIGDPIDQQIFMLHTKDSGDTWQEVGTDYFTNQVEEGESFFAASNSNMAHTNEALCMVTGGKKSRLWMNGSPTTIPLLQGLKTTGANSIAFSPDEKRMLIVGGDFANDTLSQDNSLYLKLEKGDKNQSTHWQMVKMTRAPHGYKSCVEFLNNDLVISCGTSGVDLSKNGGNEWKTIDKQSFHVVKKIPNLNSAILAGSGGRIGIIHVP